MGPSFRWDDSRWVGDAVPIRQAAKKPRREGAPGLLWGRRRGRSRWGWDRPGLGSAVQTGGCGVMGQVLAGVLHLALHHHVAARSELALLLVGEALVEGLELRQQFAHRGEAGLVELQA